MKKGLFLLIFTIIILSTSIVVSASNETFEVSLDTGIDVYSVYYCFLLEENNTNTIKVDFENHVKSYGYSNVVGNKLYVSIASASPIDCSLPFAHISAFTPDGDAVVPKLERSILKINGVVISSTDFSPKEVTAKYVSDGLKVSINVCDELLRSSVAMYVSVYNEDMQLEKITILPLNPFYEEETYSTVFSGVKGSKTVKVFFMKDCLKPISTHLECSV